MAPATSPHVAGVELAPFCGVRYATTDLRPFLEHTLTDLAPALAPPYDMVDTATAGRLLHDEPLNALRLTMPPAAADITDPPGSSGSGGRGRPDRYARAARTLRHWRHSGVLVRDPEPMLYVYEQARPDGAVQRGLVGALRLPDTPGVAVLPHEAVREATVTDRVRLMAATGANLEPVFLLYRGGGDGGGAASRAAERYAADPTAVLAEAVTGDGVRHRLFGIADPTVHAAVGADLAGRNALVADGHHRFAAYQRLRGRATADPAWGWGLAFLVDSDAHPPRLGAIHRVLPGLDTTVAAERARGIAAVKAVPAPAGAEGRERARRARDLLSSAPGPALLLAGHRTWFLLHDFAPAALAAALPGHSAAWHALPTAVLRSLLPRWERTEEAARIVPDDAVGALDAAAATDGTAVLLPPPELERVYALAERGELTPPKSTSFTPKPRTGMVLRVLG